MKEGALYFLLIFFILLISLSAFLTRTANNHQSRPAALKTAPQSSKSSSPILAGPFYAKDQFDGGFDPSTPSCITLHYGNYDQPPIQHLIETCDYSIDPITKSPSNIIYEYTLRSGFKIASADLDKEMSVYPINCKQYCQEYGLSDGICSIAKINCADQVVTAGYCNCAP